MVETTTKAETNRSPNRPNYLVGESLGGCLALAFAACNPDTDLLLILADPGEKQFLLCLLSEKHRTYVFAPTSFDKSQIQPLLPLLELMPEQLQLSYPFILSLMAGDPWRTIKASTEKGLPPQQTVEELSKDLLTMPSYVSVLADILPKETLLWKLQMLKSASAYANSRIHAVKAQTTSHKREGSAIAKSSRRWFDEITGPVMLSTLEDGRIVRGLDGIPSEGPILYVGYHMLLGLELVPMVIRFLNQRNMLLRGISHPMLFEKYKKGQTLEPAFYDTFLLMGAAPVSGTNLFKLLSSKSHVLLYPGGMREALHRKIKICPYIGTRSNDMCNCQGEEYKLFWPEQSEFVRMAVRFGAKIVPFGAVGEDDFGEVFFDYDDQMKIPYFRDQIRQMTEEFAKVRTNATGEVANQDVHLPWVRPKIPGRFYYCFGKPIETAGMSIAATYFPILGISISRQAVISIEFACVNGDEAVLKSIHAIIHPVTASISNNSCSACNCLFIVIFYSTLDYMFTCLYTPEGRKQELKDREKSHELYLQVKS
ncbi:hypothetical protein EUGRSUZ_I01584 [Eucalyptus grandis]|uniref:Uncharacterized protein n=2 Tax=Eucalyptus grandis TaxID=71139 RepID=A0ACC3JFX5_EUCGR|nr:hypothetical protein EUGRSUZ_I01584 [Eucalyptus grandis]